jgi:hypothetical protein
MPGNRFNVSELWDGVKKSTSDAWNEASQGAANLLRQIQELTTKHLPQIAIILRIVTTIPILIRDVREIGKALPKGIEGVKALLLKGIQNSIGRITKFVQGALKNTEKGLRAAFNAAIKPLPKNIQNGIKATLKPLLDGLKNSLKDALKRVAGILNEITKLRTFILTQLGKNRDAVLKGVKAPIDALGKLLRTDIGKIPKLIESKVTGIIKAVQKVGTDATKAVQKIPAEVEKGAARSVKEINTNFGNALKRFDKAFVELEKKTLQPLQVLQRKADDAAKAVGKVAQETVKGVSSKVDESTRAINKSFGEASKRFDDSVRVVQKQSGQALEELKLLPKRAAAEVGREVQVITKEVTKAGEATAKTVGKSVDDVGKSVGKMAPYIDDIGKQFPKVASHLDDILKTAGTIGRTVTSMVPIIEGIAEQINFEEIFQRLERIERRVDDNIWADILENRVRIISCAKSLDRIEARLGIGQNNTVNVDFSPVLKAIAALPKTSGVANTLDIATAVVAQMPRTTQADPITIANAVAAKIPKPDNGAIADAVVAKLPKPIDNTATLTKVIQDSIKAAPPGQTVSSDAIATAVAAKLSKPTDNNGLAAVVKTALAPSLQAIDAKLPDNGIFRVDQTGIANAVAGKLAPGAAKTDGAIAEILKQVQAIPGISKEQTQLITNAINAAKPTIPKDLATTGGLAQVVNVVNAHTTNNAQSVINNVQNIKVSAPAAPGVDLSPINNQLKDISKAIGVDQLKSAAPVDAEKLIKQAGNQQFAGGAVQGATTLAGLMAAFAAPQFFRSGSHRMGGTFDQSLMNPKAGKVQIDDAMGFHAWQFKQIDERLGMPTEMQVISQTGAIQKQQFRSVQDSVEEINGVIVSSAQDLEIIERYLFSLTQDTQKLMQICLQNRADIDVIIDDLGCKTKEVRKSHPTHIKLTAPGQASSLSSLFQNSEVHYVAREWADSADKNQKLERMSYDTQIAAMSNKFELGRTNVELPLDKSHATGKPQNDELWRTYVSTLEEPPEGYVSKGNPIPDIKEIKNGNPVNVPRPTNPLKKLGK